MKCTSLTAIEMEPLFTLASQYTDYIITNCNSEDEQMLHLLRQARLMDIPSVIALQATAAAT